MGNPWNQVKNTGYVFLKAGKNRKSILLWIKEMRYIYMMEYDSAIKKNKIMTFAQPSRTLWGLPRSTTPTLMSSACFLSAKKTSKNKFNQSEKIPKERKTMKQDKIIIV